MTEQDINSSDFKSSAWQSQQAAYELVSDWWRSPLDIRNQREKYLEKFAKENAAKYDVRLNRSVPRNRFRESIETMAGMVFKTDPAPTDVPEPLLNLFTDIDACGNSLQSFLIAGFECFLRDGGGAILVNATPLSDNAKEKVANNEQLNAADRIGDRPFWEIIEAKQIINHRYEKVNGVDVLAQVTIERTEIEPEGQYGEAHILRHYILRRGSFEVERYDAKDKAWVSEPDKGGVTGLAEIPLVLFNKIGAEPPLLDLAMLNVQHYNKVSDFDNICHLVCVPRQVINLKDDTDAKKYKELNQAADVGLMTFGEHAKVYYVEVKGDGMDIADKRNEAVAADMSAIGIGMLAPTEIAPRSATEVLDTAGQRQSKLARFAREFENAVEKAFYFTAEYLNIIGGQKTIDLSAVEKADLKLKMDFDRLTFSPEKIKFFQELLQSGDLSHTTFYEMLPQFMDMPKDWTPELEKKRLSSEEPVIQASQFDPNINDENQQTPQGTTKEAKPAIPAA